MAPAVGDRIEELIAHGRLTVRRDEVVNAETMGAVVDRIAAALRRAGRERVIEQAAA